jgi:hypothetical protein
MAIRNGSNTHVDVDVEEPPPPGPGGGGGNVVGPVASAVAAVALVGFLAGGPRWLIGVAVVASVVAIWAGLQKRGGAPPARVLAVARSGQGLVRLKPGDELGIDLKVGARARFFHIDNGSQLASSPLVEKEAQSIEFHESAPAVNPPYFAVLDPP